MLNCIMLSHIAALKTSFCTVKAEQFSFSIFFFLCGKQPILRARAPSVLFGLCPLYLCPSNTAAHVLRFLRTVT